MMNNTAQQVECPSCGTQSAAAVNFCPNCGQGALAEAPSIADAIVAQRQQLLRGWITRFKPVADAVYPFRWLEVTEPDLTEVRRTDTRHVWTIIDWSEGWTLKPGFQEGWKVIGYAICDVPNVGDEDTVDLEFEAGDCPVCSSGEPNSPDADDCERCGGDSVLIYNLFM
jgi:ribosomal protein L37E